MIIKGASEDVVFNSNKAESKKPSLSIKILKFFLILLISLTLILIMVFFTVKAVLGPVMTKEKNLPNDFPVAFNFYDSSAAEIKIQAADQKERLIKFINIFPNWLVSWSWSFLSDDIRQKLADNFGDKVDADRVLSVDDFYKAINLAKENPINSVFLEWNKIFKTKEELAAYYKHQLIDQGFEFKENLTDYSISLGFWRGEVFGLMNFSNTGDSTTTEAEIIVNYPNK